VETVKNQFLRFSFQLTTSTAALPALSLVPSTIEDLSSSLYPSRYTLSPLKPPFRSHDRKLLFDLFPHRSFAILVLRVSRVIVPSPHDFILSCSRRIRLDLAPGLFRCSIGNLLASKFDNCLNLLLSQAEPTIRKATNDPLSSSRWIREFEYELL
jgi:hypothetical protein